MTEASRCTYGTVRREVGCDVLETDDDQTPPSAFCLRCGPRELAGGRTAAETIWVARLRRMLLALVGTLAGGRASYLFRQTVAIALTSARPIAAARYTY